MKILKATREQLEKQIALTIRDKIHELLEDQDQVIMGLVGGSSVEKVYEHLSILDIDWPSIHIFPADDRLVLLSDKESNSGLISKYFGATGAHLHLLHLKKTERFGVEDVEYEFTQLGDSFDIVVLSAGEDGHVAGLFPGSTITDTEEFFFDFHNSPKPPKERMTASRTLLEKSLSAFLIFFGQTKKEVFKAFQEEGPTELLPARLCKSVPDCYVFSDN